MRSSVVFVEGSRAEIGWFGHLADEMGFSDPGTLLVGEDHGDGVPGRLEGLHKGVDIGGGLLFERRERESFNE